MSDQYAIDVEGHGPTCSAETCSHSDHLVPNEMEGAERFDVDDCDYEETP